MNSLTPSLSKGIASPGPSKEGRINYQIAKS